MSIPSDPLFVFQWHLRDTGQFGATPGVDIDVTTAWDDYTGAGVHIGVYDSGIQYNHHDLAANYDGSRSVIVNGLPYDGLIVPADDHDTHGTEVAGLIAAANDGAGTVGVAYGASLTGVPIFKHSVFIDDAELLQAVGQWSTFDIVNNSWGWGGGGFTDPAIYDPEDPGFWGFFFNALASATDAGRGGLGTIVVVSAGNDRSSDGGSFIARDNNDSNFTNSRYAIAVGALAIDGTIAHYSTPGAATFVTAPSAGSGGQVGLWTTDFLGTDGVNSGSDAHTSDNAFPDYTDTMNGTSGAAPLVTGVVALVLQANPDLGWRDVQEILAYSARHTGTDVGVAHAGASELFDWGFNGARNWNGGGLHYSNDYGYGLVDATAAVRLAETWTAQSTSANEASIDQTATVSLSVPYDNATGVSYTFSNSTPFDVERVGLEIDWLIAPESGAFIESANDLRITLTSPDGTVSTLLYPRAYDPAALGSFGFVFDWEFTSNAFRGERGVGTWTVSVADERLSELDPSGGSGVISGFKLHLYGQSDETDDTYVYTNELATYAGVLGHSQTLTDTDGGVDAINAAAVSTASIISLGAGSVSTIAGKAITIAAGTSIENAFGGDGDDTITGNNLANVLHGGRGDDTISGGSNADMLYGDAGNDRLIGGSGADHMEGGAGDDTYYVDNVADVVVEHAGQGTNDRILTTLGVYALNDTASGDVERLGFNGVIQVPGSITFAGTGNALDNRLDGSAGDDILSGMAGNDTLYGAGGNDRLDGGAGADRMYGGIGDDTYVVDSAGDRVTELAGEGGHDGVVTSLAAYTLGSNVERLDYDGVVQASGTTTFRGTGNAADNELHGSAGDDILNGGLGADTMYGGAGDDRYYLDNAGDRVVETGGEGAADIVYISFTPDAGFVMPGNVERLAYDGVVQAAGTITLRGTGNLGDNVMYGTAGDDILLGLDGADTLLGGAGHDLLNGGNDADTLRGGQGGDFIFGGSGSDRLYGSDGVTGDGANNVFAFGTESVGAASGQDIIFDYQDGGDTLYLAFLSASATTIVGSRAFVNGGGAQVRYQQFATTSIVYADTNGDAVADFSVRLLGTHHLTAADFLLGA